MTQSDQQPEQDRLATLIVDGHWLSIIGQFYLLGLLLAFTPCVLPMVPILSGVIVGLDKDRSTGLAFMLSLAYVLAMAFAYALFGAIAGLFGHNLQAAMQAPAVLIGFSALFVALSLSMFGVYKLQLPSSLQSRLSELSAKQKSGTLLGAAIMGFFSALIVGPCVAPPLAGALLYIGQTGDPMRGGMALFTLGLGMGTPLLLLGTLEGRMLPKTGAWMNRINHLFGFLLLGVAIWLLSRIASAHLIMLMWGTLTLGLGVYLGALSRAERSGWQQLEQTAGLLALVYGVLILIGAALGGSDPLRPLATQSHGSATNQTRHADFEAIKSSDDLQAALALTEQPVMLDFYADWCVACKDMEKHVFPDPQVSALMQEMHLLQADVTRNDATDKALMNELGVIGPPTMIFYHADGSELSKLRLIGELDANEFAAHLRRVLAQARSE
jgi:thiol:disulfide interchange protein DsbD